MYGVTRPFYEPNVKVARVYIDARPDERVHDFLSIFLVNGNSGVRNEGIYIYGTAEAQLRAKPVCVYITVTT